MAGTNQSSEVTSYSTPSTVTVKCLVSTCGNTMASTIAATATNAVASTAASDTRLRRTICTGVSATVSCATPKYSCEAEVPKCEASAHS